MSQEENQQKTSTTSLIQLQPEKLQTLLQQDKQEDCLSCRLTGASAFIGLGAYSYLSGNNQLRKQESSILKSGSRFGVKSRRAGIASVALAFIGVGVWRLTN